MSHSHSGIFLLREKKFMFSGENFWGQDTAQNRKYHSGVPFCCIDATFSLDPLIYSYFFSNGSDNNNRRDEHVSGLRYSE